MKSGKLILSRVRYGGGTLCMVVTATGWCVCVCVCLLNVRNEYGSVQHSRRKWRIWTRRCPHKCSSRCVFVKKLTFVYVYEKEEEREPRTDMSHTHTVARGFFLKPEVTALRCRSYSLCIE